MELKINVSEKDGKTTPITIPSSKPLHGIKIGDSFKGELIDKTGYVFVVTGGSDASGFPMRADVQGSAKKKILLTGGVGYRPKRKGLRVRKTVAGNMVGERTSQLNVRIDKAGKQPLVEAPKEEETAEAAEE